MEKKGDLWGKKVLIIREKESIITKGIANKMESLDCAVTVRAEDAPNLKEDIINNELILIYLPSDCLNSTIQRRHIAAICGLLEEDWKDTIVVGEKDQEANIIEAFPVLKDHTWLYRPVNMDILEKTVRTMLTKPAAGGNARKLLVVDDDPAFGKMIRSWLKDHYKVSVVTSGMEAFTFLAQNRVELILLDYEMPITDGPKVLEMLRGNASTQEIPVIFLTGVSTKEEVSRVLALKPNGYILKTTSLVDLLRYLEEFFKKQDEKLQKDLEVSTENEVQEEGQEEAKEAPEKEGEKEESTEEAKEERKEEAKAETTEEAKEETKEETAEAEAKEEPKKEDA